MNSLVLLKKVLDSLSFVVAPPVCVLCSKLIDMEQDESEHICNNCFLNLPVSKSSQEILERINMNFGKENNPFDYAFSLFDSGTNQEFLKIIHTLKYKKFKKIGTFLGTKLGKKIYENLSLLTYDIDSIIPVPIHRIRQKERGFNQAEIIARAIGNVIDRPVNVDLVSRKLYTQSQTSLHLSERIKNVQNAFEINLNLSKIKSRNFILVDDVITSGSTLYFCAKLLKENGANKLIIAVLTTA
ncbi:MAG: ComF family protein [Candidatus Kapaibacteriota bacterium]